MQTKLIAAPVADMKRLAFDCTGCFLSDQNILSPINSKAESFYYVNYGSSIITSKVCQIISVTKT